MQSRLLSGNVAGALKEVKAFDWEEDYRPGTRRALKEAIEHALANEVNELMARPRFQRSDGGEVIYRNGGYMRRLFTEPGDMVTRVPALR